LNLPKGKVLKEGGFWDGAVTRKASRIAHEGWKGNVLQVESPGKVGVKSFEWKLAKVSLGNERGFKIFPNNGAKILSHKP
jgi:hypothetical protein